MEDLNLHTDKESFFRDAYLHYLLMYGKEPVTVYGFCKEIKVEEAQFYNYFNSFKSLEKKIWQQFVINVLSVLENDDNYSQYSAYEKWLSFLYTLIEEFKTQRSFVVLRCQDLELKNLHPWFLDGFRTSLNAFSKTLINDGLDSTEIASRPIITSKYNEVLWFQFLYITRVWVNDESADFQTTDAAIEKSSVLLFELMKKGPVDMLIDFGKFMYQNKAY